MMTGKDGIQPGPLLAEHNTVLWRGQIVLSWFLTAFSTGVAAFMYKSKCVT